jgi:hypothetical protein
MDKIKYLTAKINELAVEVEILKEEISLSSVEDSKITQEFRSSVLALEADVNDLNEKMSSTCSNLSALVTKVDSDVSNLSSAQGDIATNTTNIATNVANISDNTKKIATNAENIAVNTQNISANRLKIEENTAKLNENSAKITTNAESIAENSSSILTNANNISSNATKITANTTKIEANEAKIATNTADIVQATEKLNNLETSQSSLSTTLANHTQDFYAERNKLVDTTGEFYGENLLINPHFTVNQRLISINQASKTYMADRWYKSCTNQVKINLQTVGTCEIRILKTVSTPVRVIEQQITLPSDEYAGRNVAVSIYIKSCTTTNENSACYGLEYFNSSGESLGVESQGFNVVGEKVFKGFIPEGTTNMTFFLQINPSAKISKIIRFCRPKVEYGTIATKFGGRADDGEINICQRYYFNPGFSADNPMVLKAVNSTDFEPSVIYFPVQMVKVPSIRLVNPSWTSNVLTCVETGADLAVTTAPVFDGRHCFKIVATNAVAGYHYQLAGYFANAETEPLNVNITDGTET